jgi:uncharacterized protein YjbI with pentapeptide repeats
MKNNGQLNFAGQNLRNRSFAGQDLRGTDFSYADLRGCNFRKACLIGANFSYARLGRSPFQTILRLSITLGVAMLMMDAVSRLVFGALGKTWEDPAWPFVLLLQDVMAGIGLATVLRLFAQRPLCVWAYKTTALLNGALLGFFYGGYFNNSNPVTAMLGAIIGFLGMAILLRFVGRQSWLRLGVAMGSTIALYGFTFFVGMWAIAAWSTQNIVLALGLSGLGLSTIWLCGYQFLQLITNLKMFPGTFFQGADLTNAIFEDAILKQADIVSVLLGRAS